MEQAQGVRATPHRGARPHRDWTPTRAEIVATVGTDEIPDWTDPQAATFYRMRVLGESPTTVSATFGVTIQTVIQHEQAATAKWERWTPADGTWTKPAAKPAPPSSAEWEAIAAAVARREQELEDMGAPAFAQSTWDITVANIWKAAARVGPQPHREYQQWEAELLGRRMDKELARRRHGYETRHLHPLRREDYDAEFLLRSRQDFIAARIQSKAWKWYGHMDHRAGSLLHG